MEKKILIIGGCGYIGSKLYLYLRQKYDVTSVDLELFGNPEISNIKINYNDLSIISLLEYTDIILLAGHSSVKMCEDNILGCFKNNVSNFIELLTKISSNQKFIYASSSSVYGNVNKNIVTEDCNEYIANNFYDLSKSEIDHYIKILNKINYYGLRFGTVNGYSPNFRNDIMINAMSMSAIKDKEIKVFNPMIRRPILYIKDLCRAIEKIIEDDNDKNRGIYNLASFNSTVDIIGRKVSELIPSAKLSIIENCLPSESDNINKKLHSKVYDFSISSDKFVSNFNFNFEGTIESITLDILNNMDNIIISNNRNIKDIIV